MWQVSESIQINATPEAIWVIWADVSKWPELDPAVTGGELEGPFENGTKGELELRNGEMTIPITIVDCISNKTFTYQSSMGGVTIRFIHEVEASGDGVKVDLTIRMEGMATLFFSNTIGKKMEAQLPETAANLKAMAEK